MSSNDLFDWGMSVCSGETRRLEHMFHQRLPSLDSYVLRGNHALVSVPLTPVYALTLIVAPQTTGGGGCGGVEHAVVDALAMTGKRLVAWHCPLDLSESDFLYSSNAADIVPCSLSLLYMLREQTEPVSIPYYSCSMFSDVSEGQWNLAAFGCYMEGVGDCLYTRDALTNAEAWNAQQIDKANLNVGARGDYTMIKKADFTSALSATMMWTRLWSQLDDGSDRGTRWPNPVLYFTSRHAAGAHVYVLRREFEPTQLRMCRHGQIFARDQLMAFSTPELATAAVLKFLVADPHSMPCVERSGLVMHANVVTSRDGATLLARKCTSGASGGLVSPGVDIEKVQQWCHSFAHAYSVVALRDNHTVAYTRYGSSGFGGGGGGGAGDLYQLDEHDKYVVLYTRHAIVGRWTPFVVSAQRVHQADVVSIHLHAVCDGAPFAISQPSSHGDLLDYHTTAIKTLFTGVSCSLGTAESATHRFFWSGTVLRLVFTASKPEFRGPSALDKRADRLGAVSSLVGVYAPGNSTAFVDIVHANDLLRAFFEMTLEQVLTSLDNFYTLSGQPVILKRLAGFAIHILFAVYAEAPTRWHTADLLAELRRCAHLDPLCSSSSSSMDDGSALFSEQVKMMQPWIQTGVERQRDLATSYLPTAMDLADALVYCNDPLHAHVAQICIPALLLAGVLHGVYEITSRNIRCSADVQETTREAALSLLAQDRAPTTFSSSHTPAHPVDEEQVAGTRRKRLRCDDDDAPNAVDPVDSVVVAASATTTTTAAAAATAKSAWSSVIRGFQDTDQDTTSNRSYYDGSLAVFAERSANATNTSDAATPEVQTAPSSTMCVGLESQEDDIDLVEEQVELTPAGQETHVASSALFVTLTSINALSRSRVASLRTLHKQLPRLHSTQIRMTLVQHGLVDEWPSDQVQLSRVFASVSHLQGDLASMKHVAPHQADHVVREAVSLFTRPVLAFASMTGVAVKDACSILNVSDKHPAFGLEYARGCYALYSFSWFFAHCKQAKVCYKTKILEPLFHSLNLARDWKFDAVDAVVVCFMLKHWRALCSAVALKVELSPYLHMFLLRYCVSGLHCYAKQLLLDSLVNDAQFSEQTVLELVRDGAVHEFLDPTKWVALNACLALETDAVYEHACINSECITVAKLHATDQTLSWSCVQLEKLPASKRPKLV